MCVCVCVCVTGASSPITLPLVPVMWITFSESTCSSCSNACRDSQSTIIGMLVSLQAPLHNDSLHLQQ